MFYIDAYLDHALESHNDQVNTYVNEQQFISYDESSSQAVSVFLKPGGIYTQTGSFIKQYATTGQVR